MKIRALHNTKYDKKYSDFYNRLFPFKIKTEGKSYNVITRHFSNQVSRHMAFSIIRVLASLLMTAVGQWKENNTASS